MVLDSKPATTPIKGTLNPEVHIVEAEIPPTRKEQDEAFQRYCERTGAPIDASLNNALLRRGPLDDETITVGDGQDIIADATERMKHIHESLVTQMTERFLKLKGRIKALQAEKDRVRCLSPRTKKDLIEEALPLLEQKKKEFHQMYLKQHLEAVQNRTRNLFDNTSINVLFRRNDEHGLFYFFLITEDDVRAAVESLPDIGLSNEDREKKLADLDAEIKQIVDEVKTEYKELCSLTPGGASGG